MVKRQHYISQGILKSFCDNSGGLYEARVYEKHIYPTKPLNAMCETYVYEHEKIDKNKIENEFAQLEGKIIPRIDALIDDVEKINKNSEIPGHVKEQVYKLLPSYLVFYYRSNALLEEFSMGNRDFKIPLMLKKIFNDKYIFRLAGMIKKNYSFCIIRTNSSFLLSDQFLSTTALKIKSVFVDISNRHIGLKDTLLLMPLSKDNYIVFWNSTERKMFKEGCINLIDDAQTFSINKTIINNSYKKCVASNKKILQEMLEEWSHQSPTQIFIGHSDKSSSGFIKKKELFYYPNDQEAFEMLTHSYAIGDYIKAKGSNPCPCRSGKQFKNCHKKYMKIIKPIYEQFGKSEYIGKITIDGTSNAELPVDSWGPMSLRYSE